ncbi:hypothetical protein V3C99_002572 [Haemonchus contortus]
MPALTPFWTHCTCKMQSSSNRVYSDYPLIAPSLKPPTSTRCCPHVHIPSSAVFHFTSVSPISAMAIHRGHRLLRNTYNEQLTHYREISFLVVVVFVPYQIKSTDLPTTIANIDARPNSRGLQWTPSTSPKNKRGMGEVEVVHCNPLQSVALQDARRKGVQDSSEAHSNLRQTGLTL